MFAAAWNSNPKIFSHPRTTVSVTSTTTTKTTTTTTSSTSATFPNAARWRLSSTMEDQTQLSSSSSEDAMSNNNDEVLSSSLLSLEERRRRWQRPDLFGTSLLDQTMQELEAAAAAAATATTTGSSSSVSSSSSSSPSPKELRTRQRRSLAHLTNIPNFAQMVQSKTHAPLQRKKPQPQILQLNIGLYCNQACGHCHVESSPLRKNEYMTTETAARCLQLLQDSRPYITTLDLTGGAPELNPSFRYLVQMARELYSNNNNDDNNDNNNDELDIIDRCNLTVLQEPGQEDLLDFLVQHNVHIIASLPCYTQPNVDQQRGRGVFDRSIAALLALNAAGYGQNDNNDSSNKKKRLQLDLVYNPLGAYLPSSQAQLERDYKQQLYDNYGIVFDKLYTITNMPIQRFADHLYQRGELQSYLDLLVSTFNPATVDGLMCRDTVSVGYDGKIYDCDFNQQLGYTLSGGGGSSSSSGLTVFDIESLADLQAYEIRTDRHCYGCTAGMGSSCQGTTTTTVGAAAP